MAWLKRLSPLVFFGIGAACGDSSGPPDGGASAPPHHLAFITQPPTLAMQSAALTPGIIVEVRDSTNAIVRGTLVVVTLALAANPGSATLLGTTAKSSSTGRVTFSDLAVNQRGRGFRLSASSDSLVAALSDSFNVVAPLPVRQIAAGDQHTCAVHTAGTTYCWGRNAGGEVGDSSTTQREFPVLVRTDLRFDTISAGIGASCGITSAGAGYCWGSDLDGKLGDSGFIGSSSPVSIKGGLTFAGPISAAFEHSCGLTTSGAAYCWGGNIFGQLGNGDSARQGSLAVVPVAGGLLFDQVRARNFHTCAIALGGAAYCWGNNSFGQLGDGTDTTRLAPQAVPGGPRVSVDHNRRRA